jgi:hypothetical protein
MCVQVCVYKLTVSGIGERGIFIQIFTINLLKHCMGALCDYGIREQPNAVVSMVGSSELKE